MQTRKRKKTAEDEADKLQLLSWLSVRLDWSTFKRKDFSGRLLLAQIEQFRINKNVDTILCRAFIGGSGGRQLEEFTTAVSRAEIHFKARSIRLVVEMYCNDYIKNIEKLTPTGLIDRMIEADFHLGITHFHEGNIAKTGAWNINNILSNLGRLKYHLGNLMGASNACPIFRQGKKEVYSMLADYCLPTLTIELPSQVWDEVEIISRADYIRLEA